MKIIRIGKVVLAIGFLAVAYSLITEDKLFKIPAEVALLIVSALAFITLFFNFRIRQRRRNSYPLSFLFPKNTSHLLFINLPFLKKRNHDRNH